MFYRINSACVVHEKVDTETFIINTLNGMYFVADGYASLIWDAIAAGYSVEQIQGAFHSAETFEDHERVLCDFFADLLSEELVFVDEQGTNDASTLSITKNTIWGIPMLSKHDDLKDLVALDPVHEVNPEKGWPFQPEV